MPKDILIYGSINEYSARNFIMEVDELEEESLNVKVNTGGGSPEYGFGMVAKIGEFEGDKSIKVDGKAFSWGAFSCLYVPVESVEALDVSEFMFHRAAYPSWYERDAEFFTDQIKGNLERVNKSLETAMRNRIDVPKFEEITGTKIKDLFSMDSRIDVFLSAAQAKKVGLIGKINKITPSKKAEIDTNMVEMAAKFGNPLEIEEKKPVEKPTAEHKPNNKNNKKMTIEEFKAKHPELFKKVQDTAFEAGVSAEKDRAGAFLVYADADIKTVLAGIKSGEPMSQTMAAELGRAAAGIATIAIIEGDNAEEINTKKPETAEAKAEKETADFLAEVIKTEKS